MCCLIHSCWRVPWRKWLRRSLFWTSSASTVPHCCEAWHLGELVPKSTGCAFDNCFCEWRIMNVECWMLYTFVDIHNNLHICNHLQSFSFHPHWCNPSILRHTVDFYPWPLAWIALSRSHLRALHQAAPRVLVCLRMHCYASWFKSAIILARSISKVYHSKSWCMIVYHSIVPIFFRDCCDWWCRFSAQWQFASHRFSGSPFRHSFSLTESMLSLFGIGQPASSHLENLGNTKSRCKSSDFLWASLQVATSNTHTHTQTHTHTHLIRNILPNFWCGMHRTCKNNPVNLTGVFGRLEVRHLHEETFYVLAQSS